MYPYVSGEPRVGGGLKTDNFILLKIFATLPVKNVRKQKLIFIFMIFKKSIKELP